MFEREVVGIENPSSPLLVISEDEARPLLVTKQLVKSDLESTGSVQWTCDGKNCFTLSFQLFSSPF